MLAGKKECGELLFQKGHKLAYRWTCEAGTFSVLTASQVRAISLILTMAWGLPGGLGCASTGRSVYLEGEGWSLYKASITAIPCTAADRLGRAGAIRVAVLSPEWETTVIAPDTPNIHYHSGRQGFITRQEVGSRDDARAWVQYLCDFFHHAGLSIIARSNEDIQRILQEQDFQLTFSSDADRIRMGQLLGVDAIIIPTGSYRTQVLSDGVKVATHFWGCRGTKVLDVRSAKVLFEQTVWSSQFMDLKVGDWHPHGAAVESLALLDKELCAKVIGALPEHHPTEGLSAIYWAELHLLNEDPRFAEFYDPARARRFIEQAENTDAPPELVAYLWSLYYLRIGDDRKFEEAGARMVELMRPFPHWYSKAWVRGKGLPKRLTDLL